MPDARVTTGPTFAPSSENCTVPLGVPLVEVMVAEKTSALDAVGAVGEMLRLAVVGASGADEPKPGKLEPKA